VTKSIRCVFAVFALCVALPGVGRAQQRPLTTEDPETVGVNRVLIEGGFEFDRDQLYSAYGLKGDTVHGPSIGVSVGISPNAEIQVDGGLLQRQRGGVETEVLERLNSRPCTASKANQPARPRVDC
jgi:hypothetical protein